MLTANDVASIVIARSGPWIDAMRLQKLLYYVQAWHLAITDEPAFREQIKAWKDGPVVPAVWHERRDRSTRRAATQSVDLIELDEITSDIIELVIRSYGSMSGEELSALTHVEQPWREARGALPEDAASKQPISPTAMATYYRLHRRLGGRTAADLAAGGIHLRTGQVAEPVDVDALLDGLGEEFDETGDNPWGGANVGVSASQGGSTHIEESARRSYADA